ncbi:MAG: RNA methyltransferase, partial [Erysipelotrichaceae bacterium]|nr:RNA methyltransferase [Erysipelotrichaceae bacterium]
QDPGNVGTIIRTALSFGFEQVICSNDCADLFNEKTIRSSQGAIFHIPYVRGDLKDIIIQLKKEGFMVVGTDLSNSVPLKELKQQGKMVIVLGNEGQGMRKDVSSLCDINVKIEMKTFDSLNVAIAGGILMYTCAR